MLRDAPRAGLFRRSSLGRLLGARGSGASLAAAWLALTVLLSRGALFASGPGSGQPTAVEIVRADRKIDLSELAERVRREHALVLSDEHSTAVAGGVQSSAPGTDASRTPPAGAVARVQRCVATVDRARAHYPPADDRPLNDLELQRLQCEFELVLEEARAVRIVADRRHDAYLRLAWFGGVPSLGILVVATVLRRGRQAESQTGS